MSFSNLTKIVADKVGAIAIGSLFVISFLLVPLLVSFHFCGNNHLLFFIVFIPLMIAVGLFWVGLARWRRWPTDKYTKASKSDRDA